MLKRSSKMASIVLAIVLCLSFCPRVLGASSNVPTVKDGSYHFKAFWVDERFEVDCVLTADLANKYDLFLDMYLGEKLLKQFPITHKDGLYYDRHLSFKEMGIDKNKLESYAFVLMVKPKDKWEFYFTKAEIANIIYDWDTQKILEDIDWRLGVFKKNNEEVKRLTELKGLVIKRARNGTPLKYAQDKIMNELHNNANIGYEKLKYYKYDLRVGNDAVAKDWHANLYIWLVFKVEDKKKEGWNYKYNSDWQVYEKYSWRDFDLKKEEDNWRNWTPWLYFDGQLISADDFGNLNLGYQGKKIGFTQDELCYILVFLSKAGEKVEGIPLIGSKIKEKLYEDPKDTYMILYGILMANQER